ncbi:MAG: Maf family protein [Leptospira sp.]|nr:Maf family protein [Leptospira sp.]
MFILKSRSPRRIQILSDLGLVFKIDPTDINEDQNAFELPTDYIKRIVTHKIGDPKEINSNDLYLACDTIVLLEEQILHKPKDEFEASEILSKLVGKKHSVISSCMMVTNGDWDFFSEETQILFKPWGHQEIQNYIKNHQPFDKAGSYGIQDEDGPVLNYFGSYQNVVGFPIRSFLSRWEKWNQYLNYNFPKKSSVKIY